jgi:ATP-binding cassette, subfamily G (WHITE), member 2, PDR
MLFRFIGSATKTPSQALAPTAVIILGAILYTGFSVPTRSMLGWSRWINRISPLAWAFESLLINELAGRQFVCNGLVPSGPAYDDVSLASRTCGVLGAEAGSDIVSGTRHLREVFDYDPSHKWRNFGILVAFLVVFTACALWTSEVVASARSKGEVLVYPRDRNPKPSPLTDPEATFKPVVRRPTEASNVEKSQTGHGSVFHWQNVCYDVQVKQSTRRILDNVDGWVKPGTLTALMVSPCEIQRGSIRSSGGASALKTIKYLPPPALPEIQLTLCRVYRAPAKRHF